MRFTTKNSKTKSAPRSNSKLDRKVKSRSKFRQDWPEYGGDLRKTREGRATARPLSYRETMHVVLRSTQARGEWSFRKPKYSKNIRRLVEKFSVMYNVHIFSMANVGNHLHIHLKLTSRQAHRAFIRAVSGAIAMIVTGASRWSKKQNPSSHQVPVAEAAHSAPTSRTPGKLWFWDHRPYSRIILTLKNFLNLKDYVAENQLEGQGVSRSNAWLIVEAERDRYGYPAEFGYSPRQSRPKNRS